MGRNQLKAEVKKSVRIQVLVTESEASRLKESAEIGGFRTVSEFMRRAGLEAAEELLSSK